ncbi:MAG TPA: amidohydrolase family protein [Granulicella sp.]|nr:amidohydrolase family protein [Granulicella sp.]
MQESTALRIDAHHHLWNYSLAEYSWIDDTMAALRRDFTAADLHEVMSTASVDGAIAIQARQTIEETSWLLDCADATDKICGVVGWAPLLTGELGAVLDGFATRGKLVGIREIVQAEPDGYLDQRAFGQGMAELTRRGLAYDLLIRERQLEEAIRLVDRHPQQRFVLDHAAKPRIAASDMEPWRQHIHALGQRGSVFCKLSGLVTESNWSHWSLDTLRPYLDVCVEAFGPHRLMAGSDWPVCLVASSYAHWWSVLDEYFAPFSSVERQRIFGGTAIEFYGLAPLLRPTLEVAS